MNSISKHSSYHSSPMQNANSVKNSKNVFDERIKDLMEQTTKLNEQIDKVTQNKQLDEKIRIERTKTLRDQIQQIEAQISQIRAEQMSKQQKDAEAEKSNASKDDTKMDVAIKIGMTFETVKTMNQVKGQMQRDSDNLKHDVRKDRKLLELKDPANADDARSIAMMKENLEATVVKKKLEDSSKMDEKIAKLDVNISKAYAKIRDTIDQASRNDKPEQPTGSVDVEQPAEENTNNKDNTNNQDNAPIPVAAKPVTRTEGSNQVERKQIDIRI